MSGKAAVMSAVEASKLSPTAASTTACTEAEDASGPDPDGKSTAQPQGMLGAGFTADIGSSGDSAAASTAAGMSAAGPGNMQLVCSSPPHQSFTERAVAGPLAQTAGSVTDGEYCINLVSRAMSSQAHVAGSLFVYAPPASSSSQQTQTSSS